ncbi:VRR-NUC domain-containing protein [bacterium]|nr:VRR-NUC domain-containing protein [bacterium]
MTNKSYNENVVETYLLKQSKLRDYLCYKFISPSNNGVPDRILIGHGLVVFVETKRPKGVPRKLQEKIIEKMRQHGASVFVIDDKEGVLELLDNILPNNPNYMTDNKDVAMLDYNGLMAINETTDDYIENAVETHLLKQSRLKNYLCYKFVSPSNNGVPDRILIGHGLVVFVETKRPKGTPRKLQEKVIEKMRQHGAHVFVINNKEKTSILLDNILPSEPNYVFNAQ